MPEPAPAPDYMGPVEPRAAPPGSLAGRGTILDYDPTPPKELTDKLVNLETERVGRMGREYDRQADAIDKDRARVQRQFEATGIEPGTLQPWNAEAERERFQTDPVQAFGSLGSVFAMIASAFTHAPMENALNAGAAAMNAIKAGDDQAYERSYTAWKDNNSLALKRHEIQHQQYQDAIGLMNTDMAAGKAKMMLLAAKYGDQKSLFLLEHGFDKELIDLQEKRNKAALDSAKAMEGITKVRLQQDLLQNDPNWNSEEVDPMKRAGYRLEAFNRIYDVKQTPQQEIMGKFFYQNPQATAEEAAEFYSKNFGWAGRPGSRPNAEQEFVKRFYQEHPEATTEEFRSAYGEFKRQQRPEQRTTGDQEFIRRFYEEHPEATVEDFTKAFDEFKRGQRPSAAGGNRDLTTERQIAAAVAKKKEQWREEGKSDDEINTLAGKETARLRSLSTPMSPNRRDQLASHITRFTVSEQTIDKVETLLKKHRALTGLGGTISRPGEVVSNWFGSNETDRAQFRRYIEELRELGPRLINESHARPLSAEESRIAAIVPGLNPGDTTANTVRQLVELKKLFGQLKADLIKRREGTWTPESTTDPDASPPPTGGDRWRSAPLAPQ